MLQDCHLLKGFEASEIYDTVSTSVSCKTITNSSKMISQAQAIMYMRHGKEGGEKQNDPSQSIRPCHAGEVRSDVWNCQDLLRQIESGSYALMSSLVTFIFASVRSQNACGAMQEESHRT